MKSIIWDKYPGKSGMGLVGMHTERHTADVDMFQGKDGLVISTEQVLILASSKRCVGRRGYFKLITLACA